VAPTIDGPRPISGFAAVLLPHRGDGSIDWDAFEAHITRTADAGLGVAVNMDTGYIQILDDADVPASSTRPPS
jgi:dihydrodipicolinate synthase/N-acetylneuraminate lyase